MRAGNAVRPGGDRFESAASWSLRNRNKRDSMRQRPVTASNVYGVCACVCVLHPCLCVWGGGGWGWSWAGNFGKGRHRAVDPQYIIFKLPTGPANARRQTLSYRKGTLLNSRDSHEVCVAAEAGTRSWGIAATDLSLLRLLFRCSRYDRPNAGKPFYAQGGRRYRKQRVLSMLHTQVPSPAPHCSYN